MQKITTTTKIPAKSVRSAFPLPTKAFYSLKTKSKPSTHKTDNISAAVQDFIGFRQVRGGLFFTSNGPVIGILEIIPINYYQRKILEQNIITDTFKGFFRIAPNNIHFKVRTEKADVSTIIRNIRMCNKDEQNPIVLKRMEEYIANIKHLQKKDTICRKFYVIFKYEGSSNDPNEIYRSMCETKRDIANIFIQMGHLIVNPDNYSACDVLYRFFNPKTMYKESLEQRISRLKADEEKYNLSVPKDQRRYLSDCDYIAPKGLNTKNPNYIIMDGQYHTYFALTDEGIPSLVNAGWLDIIQAGEGIDIDIISKKKVHDLTVDALEQYNRFNRVNAREKRGNQEKYESLSENIDNIAFITNRMRKMDEDLFDTIIIVTVRANTLQDMYSVRNSIIKSLRTKSIYVEECFLTAVNYFRMTMPFMYVDNAIFNRNKRNMLTSSMAGLYCFTSYELFDDHGYVIGSNVANNTLVSIDNYNTDRYSNPNIVIIGTPGSGKTYFQQMFGYRMRLTGVRNFFILPIKAYEYEPGCKNIGGSYIRLVPGSEDCINIMEIRPHPHVDSEDDGTGGFSLLSEKISSVIVFIQLLMDGYKMSSLERSKLVRVIYKLYERFGITDDNDSIWEDEENNVLKPMPILEDLANEIINCDELKNFHTVLFPFTDGNCQNMNGYTNVDLDNKYIVFDVNEKIVGKELLPAFLFIAYDCASSIAKEDLTEKVAIILDEVWKMMKIRECAEMVQEGIKTLRGYGGCLILSTQEIGDFIGDKEGFGASVLHTVCNILVLKINEAEFKAVSEIIDLDQSDESTISRFPPHGYGLLYSNKDKIIVDIRASETEDRLFCTDINKRKQMKKRAAG